MSKDKSPPQHDGGFDILDHLHNTQKKPNPNSKVAKAKRKADAHQSKIDSAVAERQREMTEHQRIMAEWLRIDNDFLFTDL